MTMRPDHCALKVVVTGALGHIGSFVVRDLAQHFPGAEIVMLDNLLTQRFASLFNLPATGRYRFMDMDVASAELRPLLRDTHVVVHLAAMTDAAGSIDRAEEVEANNYSGTCNVARACVDTGACFIAASSTSVYGTQQQAVSEDCSADDLKPQSPYARTKLKEEELVARLCEDQGLKGVAFRFGTIFGVSPGMRFHTAVNKFCWQAAMGQPLTVWKTAYEQKRPYLDVRDASRAIAFAIRNDLFDGRIYNVLTQNASVRQVIDVIRDFVPDVEIRFVDSPIMNQLSYEVSSARLVGQGFSCDGDLRRGIADTIALLSQANSAASAVAGL